MESFVFEQKVLFRVYFLSVTSDYRVQCPKGQNLGDFRIFLLLFFLYGFLLLFFLYGIIQFEQQVLLGYFSL